MAAQSVVPIPWAKPLVYGAGFGLAAGVARYTTHTLSEVKDILYESIACSLLSAAGDKVIKSIRRLIPDKDPIKSTAEAIKRAWNREDLPIYDAEYTVRIDPEPPAGPAGTVVEDNYASLLSLAQNPELASTPMNTFLRNSYGILYKGTVTGQAAMSEFKTINLLGQMFLRSAPQSIGAKEGIADVFPTVEALGEVFEGQKIAYQLDHRTAQKKYLDKPIAGIKKNKDAFDRAVREAYLTGEPEATQVSPEVATAVKLYKEYLDPKFEEAHQIYERTGGESGLPRPDLSKDSRAEYLTADQAAMSPEEIISQLKNESLSGTDTAVSIVRGYNSTKNYMHRAYDIRHVLNYEPQQLEELFFKGQLNEDVRNYIKSTKETLDKSIKETSEAKELAEVSLQHDLSIELKTAKSIYDKEVSELLSPDIDAKTVSTGREKNVLKVKSITRKYLKEKQELEGAYDKKINKLYEKTEAMLSEHEAEAKRLIESYQPDLAKLRKDAIAQINAIKGVRSYEKYASFNIGTGKNALDESITVKVDDLLLTDWLIHDPEIIATTVARKLDAMIAQDRVLKYYGFNSIKDVQDKFDKEWIAKKTEIQSQPESKKREKLLEEHKRKQETAKKLIENIPALVHRTYGKDVAMKYSNPTAIGQIIQNYEYKNVESLVLSAIQDPAVLVAKWGLKPLLKAYIGRFKDYLTQNDMGKQKVNHYTRIGAAMETAALRAKSSPVARIDPNGYVPLDAHIKPWIAKARDLTAWINRGEAWAGLNTFWTDFNKRVNSIILDDKLSRIIQKGFKGLTQEDKIFLSQNNIPQSWVDIMKPEIDEYGYIYNWNYSANTVAWRNREAANMFDAAIVKSSNNVVIRPGVGDTPLFLKTQLGKLALPYTSFILSASNNIAGKFATGEYKFRRIVPGFLTGFLLMGLGKYLRSVGQGDPYDLEDPKLYTETALSTDFGTYLTEVGKRAYYIGQRAIERGQGDLLKDVASNLPWLDDGLEWISWIGSSFNPKKNRKPISEYEYRKRVRLFPFTHLFYLEGAINAFIKKDREDVGAKMLDSRIKKMKKQSQLKARAMQ